MPHLAELHGTEPIFEAAVPLLLASIVAVALVVAVLLVLTSTALATNQQHAANTGTAPTITKENTDG